MTCEGQVCVTLTDECVCVCVCRINADINAVPLLRDTGGSMKRLGGPFLQLTHTHTKCFLRAYFHLEVGETEAGSVPCPVSWSDGEEDEEERCERCRGRTQSLSSTMKGSV